MDKVWIVLTEQGAIWCAAITEEIAKEVVKNTPNTELYYVSTQLVKFEGNSNE